MMFDFVKDVALAIIPVIATSLGWFAKSHIALKEQVVELKQIVYNNTSDNSDIESDIEDIKKDILEIKLAVKELATKFEYIK